MSYLFSLFVSLLLNSSKLEFLLIGSKKQLVKIHNSRPNTTLLTHLDFIFEGHLTFFDEFFYSHTNELHCIRHYLDFKAVSTVNVIPLKLL